MKISLTASKIKELYSSPVKQTCLKLPHMTNVDVIGRYMYLFLYIILVNLSRGVDLILYLKTVSLFQS